MTRPTFSRMLLVAAALALAGCNAAAPTADTSSPAAGKMAAPAAALVHRFKMGEGLRGLALDTARGTNTYGALVRQHGKNAAEQRLQGALARALPAYQPRWNQNLANLYGLHLSADALTSLANQGTASPHAAAFRQAQPQVAAEMQTLSKPLLAELVTEVLTQASANR